MEKYQMNLPKKRSAYQYCVLQYSGNLPESEYDNAIEEYEARINRLKQRIIIEKLPDEHFFYQQIKWMQGNRIELLRKTAPYLFKNFWEGEKEVSVSVDEEDLQKAKVVYKQLLQSGVEADCLILEEV